MSISAAVDEPSADLVGNSVVVDASARVALTAQIGVPDRQLQEGEWERCDRPTVTRDVPASVIVTGINEFYTPHDWKGSLGKSEFFQTQAVAK
jgi:hypothetical protein